MKNRSHPPGSSTHVVIAAFVVLVFGLYVDRKLGQEGALRGQRTRQWERNDQKANLIQTSLFSHTETTKSGFFFYSLSPYLCIGVAQRSWPNISALPHFLFYFMSSCQKMCSALVSQLEGKLPEGSSSDITTGPEQIHTQTKLMPPANITAAEEALKREGR